MIASIGVPKSIELTNTNNVQYPTCGLNGIDCYHLLKNHISRIFIGLVFFLFMVKVPTGFLRKIASPTIIITFLVLSALLFIGENHNTFARGWLIIGGVSVQPVEFAKIGLILYMARWLENKGKDLQDLYKGFLSFCFICLLLILPVAFQPDYGGAFIFAVIAVGMFFLAGANYRHLLAGFLAVVIASVGVLALKPYIRHRFVSHFIPNEETCLINDSGVARDYCWQTEQANIAVASGGFFGRGLTKGVQKAYWLPQASDDFIFAASAEELGFLRSSLVVLAFLFIGYRGLIIAKNAPDRFSMYVATGITLWLSGQAFVNMGVNTGVLPVTGITLPFISYGGSSMLANLIGAGILLNISRYSNFNYASTSNRRRNSRAYNAQPSAYRVLKEVESED